ncbi:MAG: hypothetical protein IPJ36_17965 [Simplicispira sp.]|nr:hypothetical protein [Simplicispira sp.]
MDGASSSSDFQRATVAAFLADWVPRTGRGPASDCCPWFFDILALASVLAMPQLNH